MIDDDMPEDGKVFLSGVINRFGIRSVIEIGSFQGCSAAFFARRVDRVTCIDPFEVPASDPWAKELAMRGVPNPYYSEFERNLRQAGLWHKIIVLRAHSRDVADQAGTADMVFIDGDHSYEGCRDDILLYKDRARKILVGDDYHLDPTGKPYYPGVHQAVAELLPEARSSGRFWWF